MPSPSLVPAIIVRAERPPPAASQFHVGARLKRSRLDRIFPEAIVSCMVEARPPVPREVEVVAARIWGDVQVGGGTERRELIPGSSRHRQMIAAARFALGGRPVIDPAGSGKPP